MKKFSNITIFILSIGFTSTPVLARQTVNDYIAYTYSIDNPVEHMWHERGADDTSRYVRQRHDGNTSAEFVREGQNANDREARRVGKLLWKNDQVQGDHSKWSEAKMLEWPLLWISSHVQGGHNNVN